MLVHLHVKNLALIDELEVEFTEGLNILTGETGAGKSIIMGSINLALGGKLSREMLRENADTALVELVFQVKQEKAAAYLKKQDIFLEDGQIIITRKITGNRSISKINGETCTNQQIKKIAEYLLDIYGQHEHQSLLYPNRQLDILDAYAAAEIDGQKQIVRAIYTDYRKQKEKLWEYQLDEEQRKREISFLEFEVEEIGRASLVPEEDQTLEKQYRKLANGKKIMETINQVHELTGYGNQAGGEQIGYALRQLQLILEYDDELQNLGSMLTDIDSLVNDFNRELSSYLSAVTFSDDEFLQVEQRLDLINQLKSKYGQTIDDILQHQKEAEEKLDDLQNYEMNKKELTAKLEQKTQELEKASGHLSNLRKKYAKSFEKEITAGLYDLNFANADFSISFSQKEGYGPDGYDDISFLISTNPGEPQKSLAKVVSGGELSRIMLAIKTILADKDETETLIFDEIDTGISGRTAGKVAEKMALIGRKHQILCITHLAQIAAMADTHYVIEKKVSNMETTTSIKSLTNEESINELARILGGTIITETVHKSAMEMKELAQNQKNTRVK